MLIFLDKTWLCQHCAKCSVNPLSSGHDSAFFVKILNWILQEKVENVAEIFLPKCKIK